MTNDEYKAKCQWLSEFYAEAARTGREMQTDYYDNENSTVWKNHPHGPSLQSTENHWRLKPEPDKVWVVWYPGSTVPQMFLVAVSAAQFASANNGIIMEIERPEK